MRIRKGKGSKVVKKRRAAVQPGDYYNVDAMSIDAYACVRIYTNVGVQECGREKP